MNFRRLLLTASSPPHCVIGALLFSIVAGTSSCRRETRDFHGALTPSENVRSPQLSDLKPGGPSGPPTVANPYEENGYGMSEAKTLYSAMNCVGCHAHGGGGIGPPLMDAAWRYGSRPEQVFSSIMDGRPNGMPSFRGRLTDTQAWQLAAYVRSMSAQVPPDAASNREDHMHTKPPETSMDKEQPKNTLAPPLPQPK